MKKAIFIIISTILGLSCQKNEIAKENEQIVTTKSTVTAQLPWGLHRKFYCVLGDCMCIDRKPYDCFDDIIIMASVEKIYDTIGNNPIVNNIPDIILKHIDKQYLKEVEQGILKISCILNQDINTLFFIFTEIKTDKEITIYPFVGNK